MISRRKPEAEAENEKRMSAAEADMRGAIRRGVQACSELRTR